MITTAALFDALEARRADLGISQAEVGRRAFGRSDSSALQNIKRGSAPTWENLNALCAALGLVVRIDPKESVMSAFAEPKEKSDLGRTEALRAGYLPIPWHDAAMRKGSAPVALQASWLASEGIVPDNLRAVVPDRLQLDIALAKNTVAILDTTAAQKGGSGMWCYKDGASVGICRAAFHADMVILVPSDAKDPLRVISRPLPIDFKILGRLVWSGQIHL